VKNHKGEDTSLLAYNTMSWVCSTWYLNNHSALNMSTPIQPPNTEAHPRRRNSWASPLCRLQMAQSDVCGKIHCGLDNQVSVNRKQNVGTELAVLTTYMVEFLKELLPYPKLLISYRWQTIKPTIYPSLCIFCTS